MTCHKIWILILLCLVLATPAFAQTAPDRVRLETTKGVIVVELDAKAAPKTTANFLAYVDSGFYDNTIFHRVIRGFMIQGGGFTADMRQKPTQAPIQNEADNGLKNKIGTIAMARTGDPHSATAQFFINVADNAFLDHKAKTQPEWGYCVFGKVIEGLEVVRAIEALPTTTQGSHQNVPVEPLIIKSAKRLPPPAPSAPSAPTLK
jgi:cyclophilin family peptidyl-prolyl cis-trans isomerase